MDDSGNRGAGQAWRRSGDFASGVGYLRGRVQALDIEAIDGLCGELLDQAAKNESAYRQVDEFVRGVGGMWILDNPQYWTFAYLAHDGRLVVEDLLKSLMNPHSDHRFRALVAGHIVLGRQASLQGLHEAVDLAEGLYRSRRNLLIGDRVENVRSNLGQWTSHDVLLDSRVAWTPKGQDDVFYNSHSDEGLRVALVGKIGYIDRLMDLRGIKSKNIFGVEDSQIVDRLFSWLGGTDHSYLNRFDERRKLRVQNADERVVGLRFINRYARVSLGSDSHSYGVARAWSRRYEHKFTQE